MAMQVGRRGIVGAIAAAVAGRGRAGRCGWSCPTARAAGRMSSVVVDNRPGATTMPGTEHVAAAAPDGRTLPLGTSTTFAALIAEETEEWSRIIRRIGLTLAASSAPSGG